MTPRLKNSKKWTLLPQALLEQITQAFSAQFTSEAALGSFKAEGRIYPAEIMLRVGYLKKSHLTQENMEVSLDLNSKFTSLQPEQDDKGSNLGTTQKSSEEPSEVLEKVKISIDAIASIFFDYFKAQKSYNPEDPSQVMPPELDLPLTWREISVQNTKVFFQHTTVNSDLEAEADRLLGLHSDDLVVESSESDDSGVASSAVSSSASVLHPLPKKNGLH